jgi:hypothetical protein
VSLNSRDEPSYVVPDFTADAEVRKQYHAVAKTLLIAAITGSLRRMREEHEFQRLRLEANKRAAEAVLAALDRHAHSTRSKYARIVPKQRTASGIVRPPTLFFDNIVSMGAAEKYYKQALEAANAKREALMKVRTTTRDLQRHLDKIETALVVHELEVRKHYKSDEGRLELEADPLLEDLAKQCEAIDEERKNYNVRLAAGIVGDEERRDRTMAESAYRYLNGEVIGLHCLHERELRFGALRYLMFRDAVDRIWVLEYSPDMMPLTQMRFDIRYINERYLIQRSPPPARADDEGPPRRGVHEGNDPRAYMGVDPALRQALRQFVEREKAGL